MKKYMLSFFLLLTISLVFVMCKKDEKEINLNLTEVKNLVAPADARYIKLNPAANLTETFEWDQARAEDGALVLYEVIFDQESGDFSKPFYSIVSNNRGVENKLTLTHGQLSQIAALGGSDFFQRKKIKWAVNASKGTNVKRSAQSRTIDLERPAGFANLPGNLYIYGTGTEAGNNLANALQFRRISSGVFEIFTKLSPGTYKLTDGTTGTPRQFSIQTSGGIDAPIVGGETTVTGAARTVWMQVNFNDINSRTWEVKSIRMWYAQSNSFQTTLNYTSNGEWRSSGYVAAWVPVGWAPLGEERYKYMMVYNDGTGDKNLWINSFFGDPAGQTTYPSTPEYRKVNLDKNDGSQYDWGWKMVMAEVPIGSVVDFWVTLRGSDPFYTQNYKKQ